VIQVKEISDGTKLLNIRNPWGRFEWDGDWGDNSELWTDEVVKEVKPVLDDDDGAFWMCFEDFYARFCSFNICKLKNWNELRLKNKFIRTCSVDDENQDYVIPKFYFTINSKKHQWLNIGVHQEDDRITGAEHRGLLDIGFALLKKNGSYLELAGYHDFA